MADKPKNSIRLEFLRVDIDSLETNYRREVNAIINLHANEAAVLAAKASPVGVDGLLATSWQVIPARRQTVTFDVEYKIQNTDPGAYYKLFGRAGGRMPPEQPLERWVSHIYFNDAPPSIRKLKQATFLLRRKIAREGTERYKAASVAGINRDLSIEVGGIFDRMQQNMEADLNNLRF